MCYVSGLSRRKIKWFDTRAHRNRERERECSLWVKLPEGILLDPVCIEDFFEIFLEFERIDVWQGLLADLEGRWLRIAAD